MVVIRKLSLPKKHGEVYKTGRSQKRHIERSLKDNPPPTPQATPCRLWQGAVDKDGYGRIKLTLPDGKYKHKTIHRWVVEQVIGRELKTSEFILHACDHPPCYRYEHLSIGTVKDNNADMMAKGRAKKPPVNRLHGESNGRAKLTPREVERIRTLYQQGVYAKTLGEMYGVSRTTITKIIRGVSWKHNTVDLLAEHRQEEP